MGIILNGEAINEIVLKRADGHPIDLLHIKPEDFTIEYLAHTLSLNNRYGGHTAFPYPVTTHSVIVSLLLPGYAQYEGLMHDLTEGTGIGDLVNPIKRLCPDYKIIEDFIRFQLAKIFHFSATESRVVKAADQRAFQLEDHYLRGACIHGITETEQDICNAVLTQEITPEGSAKMFLDQYHWLRGHGTRPELH